MRAVTTTDNCGANSWRCRTMVFGMKLVKGELGRCLHRGGITDMGHPWLTAHGRVKLILWKGLRFGTGFRIHPSLILARAELQLSVERELKKRQGKVYAFWSPTLLSSRVAGRSLQS